MHRIEIAALFDGAGRNAYFSVTVSQEEAKEIAAALRVVAECALADDIAIFRRLIVAAQNAAIKSNFTGPREDQVPKDLTVSVLGLITDVTAADNAALDRIEAALALRARPVVAAVSPTREEVLALKQVVDPEAFVDDYSPSQCSTAGWNDALDAVAALYAQATEKKETI